MAIVVVTCADKQDQEKFVEGIPEMLSGLGIVNDHRPVEALYAWLESTKVHSALGICRDGKLDNPRCMILYYLGSESNYFVVMYEKRRFTGKWLYAVVFDVKDENKALMLKLTV